MFWKSLFPLYITNYSTAHPSVKTFSDIGALSFPVRVSLPPKYLDAI